MPGRNTRLLLLRSDTPEGWSLGNQALAPAEHERHAERDEADAKQLGRGVNEAVAEACEQIGHHREDICGSRDKNHLLLTCQADGYTRDEPEEHGNANGADGINEQACKGHRIDFEYQ